MDGVKVTVDERNKIVRAEWYGKPDLQAITEGCNTADNALRKFKKGEPMLLGILTGVDFRLLPPGADKIINESNLFTVSHCKKVASVVTSLMLQKSLEKQAEENFIQSFSSEQEALKWLLDK